MMLARGPVTALGCFIATATFAAGQFFLSMYQTTSDCAKGSTSAAACGTDILETVVAGLIAVGSAAGATYVGLVSPTPRDLVSPVFRVDGVDVDWATGMGKHFEYGLNRTSDVPTTVEWQLNHTSATHKYITYTKDGQVHMRHDTGFDVPTKSWGRKRSSCRAYLDVIVDSDSLRSSELQVQPSYNDYLGLSTALFNYYKNNGKDSGCVFIGTSDGIAGAKFDFGASCSQSVPTSQNCQNVEYTYGLYLLNT